VVGVFLFVFFPQKIDSGIKRAQPPLLSGLAIVKGEEVRHPAFGGTLSPTIE
jgi:hypothetical protein